MRVAILGATGKVGSLLMDDALARGFEVTALVRDPAGVAARPNLERVAADVNDAGSVARAVKGSDVLVSALGGPPGTLVAGAKAVVASGIGRIVWLGAYGTGESAQAAGLLTRSMLSLFMRQELPDKTAADALILAAGGTVFHVGPMGDGPASHRTLLLEDAPKRLFPAGISRAAVAAAMLDEVQEPYFPGRTVVAVPG
ncbi:NAD(P)-binding oxidoreductase [Kineosporia sp. NBRC 101731]|uniref:NAD(P)-dependent oxidoreductase n=1 Tax=Kineosporia sp. NBRC 101731 TaxID=3032199 RepID=UPI002553520C|nr:NAD(P)-binding oxidoreductase [Kineosporia sp. NBRC 101731]